MPLQHLHGLVVGAAVTTLTVLMPHADLPGREGFFAEAKASVLGADAASPISS